MLLVFKHEVAFATDKRLTRTAWHFLKDRFRFGFDFDNLIKRVTVGRSNIHFK